MGIPRPYGWWLDLTGMNIMSEEEEEGLEEVDDADKICICDMVVLLRTGCQCKWGRLKKDQSHQDT